MTNDRQERSAMHATSGGPLMWIMPLHLHIHLDDDDDETTKGSSFSHSKKGQPSTCTVGLNVSTTTWSRPKIFFLYIIATDRRWFPGE